MLRKLRIQILQEYGGDIHIRIIEQSHTGDQFSEDGSYFRAAGVVVGLESIFNPAFIGSTLFTQGTQKDSNLNIIKIPRDKIGSVLDVVLLYNQHYSKNTLELSDVVEGLDILENINV